MQAELDDLKGLAHDNEHMALAFSSDSPPNVAAMLAPMTTHLAEALL